MITPDDPRLQQLLQKLSLHDKVSLLTGRDFWSTVELPSIGLRSMVLSDGPSGVRGPVWDERDPSLNLPSSTALASSWDLDTAYTYGAVAAAEARRKGVDVVLGPTINIHRSPLGGRHFEAFSEDPLLTAELAAAYVRGVQDNGVGATPKHYVANDFETDRFTVDVQVSDRALREVYLAAFELAITESRAWLVMSAYNAINGVTATENDLLANPLNDEWGFDGVVVSDWTAVRSLDSARAAQDLVMPGPDGPWGAALEHAIESGEIALEVVDRKVLRLLTLAARVGALEGFEAAGSVNSSRDGRAMIRAAASQGSVLVRNRDELPWNSAPASIAVIGHNAILGRTQGGGSATVLPESIVSPWDGIVDAFPASDVRFALGAVVHRGIAELPLERISNPITNEPGLAVSFLDAAGETLFHEDRRSTALVWFGGDAPIARSSTLVLDTVYVSPDDAEIDLGFASVGHATIEVDGQVVLDATLEPEGTDLGAAFLSPPSTSVSVSVRAGVPVRITVRVDLDDREGPLANALSFRFGTEVHDDDPQGLIAEAQALAAQSEVAVVVVGTNADVESEGFDRASIELPGRQDDLVRAVVVANPRTVVVVNAGSPVSMPWLDDVAAALIMYFPGQEFGAALGDMLTGVVEPGGRLTTTWAAVDDDLPVREVTPRDGALRYDEGIHVGYRAWLRHDVAPALWFGEGLGYTTWSLDGVRSAPVESGERVTVTVTNSGDRAGSTVVQVYASRQNSTVDRPARWLVGFARVSAAAGATVETEIMVHHRRFAHWNDAWILEPGEFTLHAGFSVAETPREIVAVVPE